MCTNLPYSLTSLVQFGIVLLMTTTWNIEAVDNQTGEEYGATYFAPHAEWTVEDFAATESGPGWKWMAFIHSGTGVNEFTIAATDGHGGESRWFCDFDTHGFVDITPAS